MHETVPHQHAPGSPHSHSHAEDEPEHGHSHSHGEEQAPATNDNLILDIGGDTGALIVYATADRDQAEVEISPAGSEQARSHNIVRLRQAPGGSVYAAVFPALAAGDYVVWQDGTTKAGQVLVHGGEVARFRLG